MPVFPQFGRRAEATTVQVSPRSSLFGRHEFAVRRVHSLLGLAPIGGYLVFHLFTNGSIIDGPATYQARADQIHALGATTVLLIGWGFIFTPILLHGLIGLAIVARGERNLLDYRYEGNLRYTLQRWTGVIAFVFIVWHVFQMHGWFQFAWWREYVLAPLGGGRFDPANAAASAAEAIRSSPYVLAFYVLGVLASVYHLANGLWTMGITWGVWTAPAAQRWAGVPCALAGLALAVVGIGSLYGFTRVPLPERGAAALQAPALPAAPAVPPASH